MRIRPSGPDFGVIAASENTGIPAPESIAARRCGLRARIVKSKSTSRPALGDRQFLPAVPGGSLSRFVAPVMLPPRTSTSMTMPGAMRKPAEEAGIHRIKFHAMYRKKILYCRDNFPDPNNAVAPSILFAEGCRRVPARDPGTPGLRHLATATRQRWRAARASRPAAGPTGASQAPSRPCCATGRRSA